MAESEMKAPSFVRLIMNVPVTIEYTNWKGETAIRQIQPMQLWYGATEFHPEPQMLLTALDIKKNQFRDFAVKDIKPVDWAKE